MIRYILVLAIFSTAAAGNANLLPNPSFEQGTDGPASWSLQGEGRWSAAAYDGYKSISVTGTGEDSSYWRCPVDLQTGHAYRLSFHARATASGGNMICGLDYLNRDQQPTAAWRPYSLIFTPRPSAPGDAVRLGHWHRSDTVYFDQASLTEVLTVHAARGNLTLGQGERIHDNRYTFEPQFDYEGSNISRPLHGYTCGFNTDRWTLDPGTWIVYRHSIADIPQGNARVGVNIGYHTSGVCIVEAGTDREKWTHLGTIEGLDNRSFAVPEDLLPAKTLYVRLRASGPQEDQSDFAPGSFQIHGYSYTADLAQPTENMTGSTRFLIPGEPDSATPPPIDVEILSLGSLTPGGDNALRLALRNRSRQARSVSLDLRIESDTASQNINRGLFLPDASRIEQSIPYTIRHAGDHTLTLSVDDRSYVADFHVPSLYDASYGYRGGVSGPLAWWWCEGTYKVSRERPVPEKTTARPIHISAARGEYEPVQIVLRPRTPLQNVRVSLAGDDPLAQDAQLLQVAYHYVHRPTDSAGCIGYWPDALPPLDGPIDLEADRNQPIWLLVKVPEDASAGDHTLNLAVSAEGIHDLTIPVRVRVRDFTLPQQNHLTTAFGLSASNIRRYHNLQTIQQQRQVWDLYMQSFRNHRISPYDFAPFDPIRVDWKNVTWQGGHIVEDRPASGKRCLRIEDDSDSANAEASLVDLIPVRPDQQYSFAFQARAEDGAPYQTTISRHDPDGNWLPGHNLDRTFTANGGWQRHEIDFRPGDNASAEVRYVRITFRAVPWSEAGTGRGVAFFDDVQLAADDESDNLVHNPGFEADASQPVADLDFTAWDRQARRYLDGYGFTDFRLNLHGMGSGTFHSRHPGRIGPYEQGSERYEKAFSDYAGKLQAHLDANGWLDKAYAYWFDEPDPKDYDFVRDGMERIGRAAPKLRRMLTEEPVQPLFGCVDAWCPVLHNYNAEDCRARQEQGERIWWYVCTGPKAPYPGLFIDHSAVDLRIWLWMTWKWDVQGILVWESNYWSSSAAFPGPEMQNPWTDPMGYVGGYSYPAGFVGYWGNGDGRFLYPPTRDPNGDNPPNLSGPVGSIRWEMLREGIEDYEYFHLLRELVDRAKQQDNIKRIAIRRAEILLTIPPAIVTDKTDFTRDPQPMYDHRERLADAIEELTGILGKED